MLVVILFALEAKGYNKDLLINTCHHIAVNAVMKLEQPILNFIPLKLTAFISSLLILPANFYEQYQAFF